MTPDHDHLLAQAEIIGTSAANYPAGTRVISIAELETLLQASAASVGEGALSQCDMRAYWRGYSDGENATPLASASVEKCVQGNLSEEDRLRNDLITCYNKVERLSEDIASIVDDAIERAKVAPPASAKVLNGEKLLAWLRDSRDLDRRCFNNAQDSGRLTLARECRARLSILEGLIDRIEKRGEFDNATGEI